MTPEELKKQFDKLQNAIANFKTENDEAIKNKADGAEVNTKLDKMADDIAKQAEEYNNKIAQIQAMAAAPVSNADRNENELREAKKAFNEFARNGKQMYFNEYCEANKIELNAISSDSDPDGGYMHLPTYGQIQKTRNFETSPIRQLASGVTISGTEFVLPLDYDEADVTDGAGERSTRSETDTPELGELIIPVHDMYAHPKVSQRMLNDPRWDVEAWLSNKVDEKFTRKENTNFITGNGVKRARGILTYTAWTTNGTFEHGKIEQINSGVSALPTVDGLIDTQNALLEFYQSNATWLMKRATFGLIAKLKDGNGQYLFNRTLDRSAGTPFDLLSAPVRFADDMTAAGANSLSIAYGDFREGYQIVDNANVTVLRDPYSSKPWVIFYTNKQVGGAVKNFEAIKICKFAA